MIITVSLKASIISYTKERKVFLAMKALRIYSLLTAFKYPHSSLNYSYHVLHYISSRNLLIHLCSSLQKFFSQCECSFAKFSSHYMIRMPLLPNSSNMF